MCAELCTAKEWRHAVVLHEGSARVAAQLALTEQIGETLMLRARQLPPPQDDHALRYRPISVMGILYVCMQHMLQLSFTS